MRVDESDMRVASLKSVRVCPLHNQPSCLEDAVRRQRCRSLTLTLTAVWLDPCGMPNWPLAAPSRNNHSEIRSPIVCLVSSTSCLWPGLANRKQCAAALLQRWRSKPRFANWCARWIHRGKTFPSCNHLARWKFGRPLIHVRHALGSRSGNQPARTACCPAAQKPKQCCAHQCRAGEEGWAPWVPGCH